MIRIEHLIELRPVLMNPRLPEQLKSTAIASLFIGDSGWNRPPNFCAGTRVAPASRSSSLMSGQPVRTIPIITLEQLLRPNYSSYDLRERATELFEVQSRIHHNVG